MQIFSFLKLWLNIIRNSIATLKRQSSLKILFILFCSIIFLATEFFICHKTFLFIRDFPGVGSIVSDRLMYLFYFILFLMLIFSNAITAYSTIYRSKDTELLFTYPLSAASIFRYKFIESNVLSSWAFLVLLVPFMASYGIANNANNYLYPLLFLFFIPFLMVTASIGACVTMFLVNVLSGKKVKGIIFLIGGLTVFCIYIFIKKIKFQEADQTLEIFILNQMLPNIHLSHSPILPSYWMVEAILKASRSEFKDALFYFLLLLSSALFFMEVLTSLSARFYLKSWQEMRSQTKKRLFIMHKGVIERLRPIFLIFGRPFCGLITKDMKLFWRDPMQWSQFAIFFGILAVYFVNIRNFSYNMLDPFWKNICAFLNLSATLLTLGSLSTRFLFPQISLEGSKFWIIGLSSLGLKKVLYEKFWSNVIICLFITEPLLIISNKMLGISGIIEFSFIWVVFIMNLALVGLSIGLGAAFPDFKSENPASIVSGFGGTLTLILSIGFILITVFLLMLPFQLFLKGHISTYVDLKKTVLLSLSLISVAGIILSIAPLMYGERRLAKMEF